MLATRLTEDPRRSVCLLEAGPDYLHVDHLPPRVRGFDFGSRLYAGARLPSHEWAYVARATGDRLDMPVPRGRVVGGSSSINGTVFLRALRQDLDGWAAAGNDAWSYADCLPYFRKLESDADFADDELHGAAGPIAVCRAGRDAWQPPSHAYFEACTDLGHADCPDMNRPDARGVGPIPINYRDGLRYSSAVGYLIPTRPRPNLEVIARALVTRVCIAGGRASAVQVVRDGSTELITADEIILSAGAIGSPHLLMLSGIGPADQLQALGITPLVDLSGVGQHVMDHPFVATVWDTNQSVRMFPGTGVPWQLQLRTSAPGSELQDDGWLTMIMATSRDSDDGRAFTIPCSLMYARSVGELRLVSDDPCVAPSLDFNYLAEPSDLERLRSLLQLAIEIGHHRAFDGIRRGLRSPSSEVLASRQATEQFIAERIATGHHVSCTCRMGPGDDPTAVVDQHGRVYGVDGLRVIDASILPECPGVNLNATVIMLAEKLADQLRIGD